MFEPAQHALAKAMRKAMLLFQSKELLGRYRTNGMTANFSWAKAVKEFEAVYSK